ncbi:MAG: hypothetical protein PVI23_12795 [Maricaulaceae bacterium]|jgi:hypothetical protein
MLQSFESPDVRVVAGAQTAFVLGNGPSLAKVSLPSLSPFATIGLNAAYRFWRMIDWRPRYYACLDSVVGLSHRDGIASLILEDRIEAFLLRANLVDALGELGGRSNVLNFDALRSETPVLSSNPVTTGSHAALWAVEMGFAEVILLGVDNRYKELVDGAVKKDGIELEIAKPGENPNYFFKEYQQPGDRYQTPNPRPNLHRDTWRAACVLSRRAGAAIYNATPQSSVRCFPFVDLGELLATGAQPVPAEEQVSDLIAEQVIANLPRAHAAQAAKPRTKIVRFIRANAALCLAAGAALAIVLAALLAARIEGWGAYAFAGAASYLLFVAGLYVRHAVVERLSALQHEVDGLRARLLDLEARTSNTADRQP